MGLFNKFSVSKSKNKMQTVKSRVVEHLTNLFGSKKKFSFFQNSFGLDCHEGESHSKQLVQSLQTEIEEVVTTYEERLRLEKVEIISCTKGIAFRLFGVIEEKNCTLDFVLEEK